MPGAVFLSYASQDTEAARKICEALRTVGVEVWFDQSELRGGDAWDQKIRKQIKECALFMPVISANTQQRHEGYFRLEWHLAEQRSHLIARGRPFIVPVSVDDTRDTDALVPDAFLAVQWMRLAGGEATPAFCERVKGLLSREVAPVSDRRPGTAPVTDAGQRPAPPIKRRLIWPWIAAAIVALPVLYLIFKPRRSPEEIAKIIAEAQALAEKATPKAVETKPAAAPAVSPARELATKARTLFDALDSTRDDFKLAEELVTQARARDGTDAEVWAAEAQLHGRYLQRGWDTSDARREAARAAAQRALRLDPQSFEARFAQANQLSYTGREGTEKEQILRDLRREQPADHRVLRELGSTIERQGRTDEGIVFMEEAAALPGGDPLALYNKSLSLWFVGRTAEAETAMQAALAQKSFTGALLISAWYAMLLHGDLARARATLDGIAPAELLEDRGCFFAYELHWLAREPDAALARLAAMPRDWINDNWYRGPKGRLTGDALQLAGRTEAAVAERRAALRLVDARLATNPTNPALQYNRILLLANLGERDEATRQLVVVMQQAGLDPASDRPVPALVARAYILLGRRTEAIEQIRRGLKQQRRAVDYTAALLRLDPAFDPLRTDPEFAQVIAEAEAIEKPAPLSSAAPPAPDEKSVAVLAFANLSDDKGNEYFSDGISEELLNVLAKVPGLKVTARTSSFHFKGKDTPIPEIAKQLGVAYVIEGSVRKAGDKVRITAQLIKAADGFHVWSDTFTRDLKDIFAVQDEIAGLIAKNLRLKLDGAARAAQVVNPQAHQLYLQGKYFLNQYSHDNAQRAADLLQRAVELDPDFALAWAALSRSHSVRGGYADSLREVDESFALARRAAERALALDPDLAAAHLALAEVRIDHDYDWKGAAESLRRAQALAPTEAAVIDTATRLAYATGQRERAAELGGQAVALDPVNPALRIYYGFALNAARRFPEAEAQFRRVIELNPTIPWGHAGVSFTLTAQGRFDEAAAEAALEVNEWSRLTTLAMARWGQRKQPDADAVLAQLIKSNADVAAYQIAEVYAFRDDRDRAFEWLERAYRQRDAGLAWSKSDISLENLHADPRWAAFMKKLGLADDQLK